MNRASLRARATSFDQWPTEQRGQSGLNSKWDEQMESQVCLNGQVPRRLSPSRRPNGSSKAVPRPARARSAGDVAGLSAVRPEASVLAVRVHQA